jgi:hypothetical protein
MKSKELRKIIREAVLEVLNEQATIDVSNPSILTPAQKQAAIQKARTSTKNPKIGTADEPVEFVEEGEIKEMARVAKGFRLADPNFDASQYAAKRVSGVSMEDIINYFRENPGAEKTQLQAQFNFARPQIANALVNGLLDAGVLVKLGRGGEVEAPPAPGEEPAEREEPIRGGEEFLIGPYLDLGVDRPSTSSEEETDDEEPIIEPEKIEKTTAKGGMSDEDYQAFIKYSELKDRLNATKTNINKTKRSKGIIDIGPNTKDEDILRLTNLKKSLEDRMAALIASSKYLQDKIAKEQTGKIAAKAPEIEPVEDKDEDVVAENYEYERRQLQYRAGIIR